MLENVFIYSPVHFENWDWRNSIEKGIGGSETCHVELTWRLAQRGYHVTSFAPLPDDIESGTIWRGSKWERLDEADFSKPGLWIIFRNAECIDKMVGLPSQRIWLMCQDESPIGITEERAAKCEKVGAYCEWHKKHMERHWPCVKGKVWITSNGLKVDLIQQVENKKPKIKKKFGFDWFGTLETNHSVQEIARGLFALGHEVHVISAIGEGVQYPYLEAMKQIGVPCTSIREVRHGDCPIEEIAKAKLEVMQQLGIHVIYEDSLEIINRIRSAGLEAVFSRDNIPVQRPPELDNVIIRNPKRMMFASSPDRGVITLCKIFKRAREFVNDLELHIFYGTDNIEKLIDYNPRFSGYKKFLVELKKAIDQPGVTWHGRIGQEELYQQMLMSGIWCYPTNFGETSCIQCMEQQALGAIPITRPLAALGENVQHGVFIQGNPDNDPLIRARYVAAVVAIASNSDLQDTIRKDMTRWARQRFDWERIVDQLESWILEDTSGRFVYQWAFQRKHAKGSILNIGCNCDPGEIKSKGNCINVDVCEIDPNTKIPNKTDILADARDLPKDLKGFDSIVIGELLEHMDSENRRFVLKNAEERLNRDGIVVLTVPEDYRTVFEQHGKDHCDPYVNGVSSWHEHPVTLNDLIEDLKATGLKPVIMQKLSYFNFTGNGIVATREKSCS